MTDANSSYADSRWPQLCAVMFAFVLIASFVGAPLTTATAAASTSATDTSPSLASLTTTTTSNENTTYYHNFSSDGTTGWDTNAGSPGTYIRFSDSCTCYEYGNWTDGPDFSNYEGYTVEQQYRMDASGTSDHNRLGYIELGHGLVVKLDSRLVDSNTDYGHSVNFTNSNGESTIIGNFDRKTDYNISVDVDGGTASFYHWKTGNGKPETADAVLNVTTDDTSSGDIYRAYSNGGAQNDNHLALAKVKISNLSSPAVVTGQAKGQDGNPISNATVHITGVDYSNINPGAQTARERANELLDEAENPLPANFDRSLDVRSQYLEGKSEEVPLAYTREDIATAPWTDQAELVPPNVVLPADEPVVFAPWNPDGNSGLLGNEYSNQLPGTPIDKGPVVVEQIGPDGSVVQTQKVAVDKRAGGGLGDPSSMPYGETRLSPGIYRISLEGDDAARPTRSPGRSRTISEPRPINSRSARKKFATDSPTTSSRRRRSRPTRAATTRPKSELKSTRSPSKPIAHQISRSIRLRTRTRERRYETTSTRTTTRGVSTCRHDRRGIRYRPRART